MHNSVNNLDKETSTNSTEAKTPYDSLTGKGDPEAGYQYLLHGNAFNTGVPIGIYKYFKKPGTVKILGLAGFSKYSFNDFVIFNKNGIEVATPGCLHCHAQYFNNELVIGLGNSFSQVQVRTGLLFKMVGKYIKTRYGKNSAEWNASEETFVIADLLKNTIRTEMRGCTTAQKIAEVMASHHDPVTLKFRPDTSYFKFPEIVVPEDVPALWISKKKKIFGINALRQGDILKHITSTSILTIKDTFEAREIYNNSKNVWAYLQTLQPPKYPFPVNDELAGKGKQIFLQQCARCHGTYDPGGDYPNKIIKPEIIGTDSLMWKYFVKYPEYAEWFNKSWFATSASPAYTKPQVGYVPPPLDGVWITAPYLHNGSVPDIESLLNSKLRPRYWKRNFMKQDYNYKQLGWRYKKLSKPGGKKTYNSDVPGYGNYGHTFGDRLNDDQRKSVIEYLKTL